MPLSPLRTPKWFSVLLISYIVPLIVADLYLTINPDSGCGLVGCWSVSTLLIAAWYGGFPLIAGVTMVVGFVLDLSDARVNSAQKRVLLGAASLNVATLVFSIIILRAIPESIKLPGVFLTIVVLLAVSSLPGTLYYRTRMAILRSKV